MGNCASSKQNKKCYLQCPSKLTKIPSEDELLCQGYFQVEIFKQTKTHNSNDNGNGRGKGNKNIINEKSDIAQRSKLVQNKDYYVKVYRNVLLFYYSEEDKDIQSIFKVKTAKIKLQVEYMDSQNRLQNKQSSQENLDSVYTQDMSTYGKQRLKSQSVKKQQQCIKSVQLINSKLAVKLTQQEIQNDKLTLMESYFKTILVQQGFWEKYQVLDKLGQGAFASVFLVVNRHTQGKYAVKVLNRDKIAQQEKGLQGLELEINILRNLLDCDNVIKIQEIFESSNSVYIILNIHNGGTLDEKIIRSFPLREQTVKEIMKQLLKGIQYIKEQNVIHRDLKPDNILFKENNSNDLAISDFGLATFSTCKSPLFLRCGTPGYVAPEVWQANNFKDYDSQCDMYSLGIIFHKILFKVTPFQEYEDIDTLIEKNSKGIIDFSKMRYQKLDRNCFDLLKQMLEKTKEKRITVEQALKHDYFNKDEKLKNSDFSNVNLECNITNTKDNSHSMEKRENYKLISSTRKQRTSVENHTIQENKNTDDQRPALIIKGLAAIEENDSQIQEQQRIIKERKKIQEQRQKFHENQKNRFLNTQSKRKNKQTFKRKSILTNHGDFILPNTPIMQGRDFNKETFYDQIIENTPQLKNMGDIVLQRERITEKSIAQQTLSKIGNLSQITYPKITDPIQRKNYEEEKQKELERIQQNYRKKKNSSPYEIMNFTSMLTNHQNQNEQTRNRKSSDQSSKFKPHSPQNNSIFSYSKQQSNSTNNTPTNKQSSKNNNINLLQIQKMGTKNVHRDRNISVSSNNDLQASCNYQEYQIDEHLDRKQQLPNQLDLHKTQAKRKIYQNKDDYQQ